MISEQILRQWASAPTVTKYKHAYEEVRKALEKYLPSEALKSNASISSANFQVYLQGSYANGTSIKEDSDVDIIVELKDVLFSYDVDSLTQEEINTFHTIYPNTSSYSFKMFKNDVYNSLKTYFGEKVKFAPKSLKIPGDTLNVSADVVACFEHRKYERFTFYTRDKYVPGIKFYNTETQQKIVNYPKQHQKNCDAKNVDTEGKFKDAIRIFKNFNRELKEKGLIEEKTAPSYFIENMIYNGSSQVFNGSYSDIVLKSSQFLTNDLENGRLSCYQCANEQDLLFGPNGWEEVKAKEFIFKTVSLLFEKV